MKTVILYFCLHFIDAVIYRKSHRPVFEGRIAGNLTLAECINGGELSDSGMDMTTSDMIKKSGYPVEEHVVLTEDGYLLTVHRIPGEPKAPPVFLQHGILSSSFEWVLCGKDKALAFLLADLGYDVWMGNARGNTYSRCHTEYNTSDSEFWNFSWHEMGIYDLPAVITYITNQTNQPLIYIGHSMGTTASYVMATKRPDIASKVKVIFSLAPVAYLTHGQSMLRYISTLYGYSVELLKRYSGAIGVLPQRSKLQKIIHYLCTGTLMQRKMCAHFVFPFVGHDAAQFNYTLLPLMVHHFPAGTSLKTMMHFHQLISTDRFQNYDYGAERNLELYYEREPPEYELSKIQVPVGLFWSENDFFSHPDDVKRLSDQLPNVILNHKIELPDFNHIDYLYGIDAYKYVYSKLLSTMEIYR